MSLSHPPRKPRLLVLSSDAVGREMAGTGIRSYELARALRDDADVTLAAVDADADGVDIPVVAYSLRDPKALWTHLEAADAVLAQPQWPHIRRRLVRSRARVMYDLYTPEILEVLERRPPLRSLVTALTGDKIADALHTGHHFLCASEKQRDLWLGAMLGERLVRPPVYDADPSLAQRLAVVPFGVDARPPEQGAGGPR